MTVNEVEKFMNKRHAEYMAFVQTEYRTPETRERGYEAMGMKMLVLRVMAKAYPAWLQTYEVKDETGLDHPQVQNTLKRLVKEKRIEHHATDQGKYRVKP